MSAAIALPHRNKQRCCFPITADFVPKYAKPGKAGLNACRLSSHTVPFPWCEMLVETLLRDTQKVAELFY